MATLQAGGCRRHKQESMHGPFGAMHIWVSACRYVEACGRTVSHDVAYGTSTLRLQEIGPGVGAAQEWVRG